MASFMKRFLTALLLAASAHAEDGAAFFEAKVLPLLRQRCYECHSHESKIKGGLALDSKYGWQTGGDHGAAITPGNVSKSLLVEAIRYTNPDMEMPPKGKLAAKEIELLESGSRWAHRIHARVPWSKPAASTSKPESSFGPSSPCATHSHLRSKTPTGP